MVHDQFQFVRYTIHDCHTRLVYTIVVHCCVVLDKLIDKRYTIVIYDKVQRYV